MLWVLLQRRKTKRATTTLGVIFLGLPVSTLSGGNVAGQIAQLKGHKNTLEQTQIRKAALKVNGLCRLFNPISILSWVFLLSVT